MKKTILAAIGALIGVFSPVSAKAQLWGGGFDGDGYLITPGSLSYSFLAFKSASGTGASTDIIFQLGDLNTLLDNGASFTINQSAVDSLLSSTYGSDWATAGNVSWAVLGFDDNSAQFTRSAANLPATIRGDNFNTLSANIANFDGWALGADLFNVTTSLGSITAAVSSDTLSGSFSAADTDGFGGVFPATVSSLSSPLSFYKYSYADQFTQSPAVLFGSLNQSAGTFTFTAIPEPSTYALVGLGALLLFIAYRRKSA